MDAQKREKEEAYNARQKTTEKKSVNSDEEYELLKKHYFDCYLKKGEVEKEKQIRFLPWSATDGAIFKKFMAHSVKVKNKDGGKSWQTYMCAKNEDPNAPCPFCELAAQAKQAMFDSKDPNLRDKYKDILKMNEAKVHYIARLVDRDAIEDGVKFWRFKDTKKGVFDQIYDIKNAKAKRNVDIFNPYEGKDLYITIKKNEENKTVISIVDGEEKCPIFDTEEKMLEWVEDTTDYKKLFPQKPYDWLEVFAKGGYPVYSKEFNRYIDKYEMEKVENEAREQELRENITESGKDFSEFTLDTGFTETNVSTKSSEGVPFNSLVSSNEEDDKLPY